MKKLFLTSIIALTIGFFLGVTIGTIIGIKINKENTEKQIINSTVILERIKEHSFLITHTVITEQSSEIIIDQGSAWSNFWWGHEITAEGLMQVDIGVDLSQLTSEDLTINTSNRTIKINVPDAEIYNVSLNGDIEVSTKSGILKKLLAEDENEDYNLALEELSSKAQEAIEQDSDIMQESKSSTLSTLQVILHDTGYTIIEE